MKRHVAVSLTAAIAFFPGTAPTALQAESTTSRHASGDLPPQDFGRIIRIDDSTRRVAVEQFELVTLANDKGQRFTWRVDTVYAPTGFPLRKVAPPGFECGSTWIYVDQPGQRITTRGEH